MKNSIKILLVALSVTALLALPTSLKLKDVFPLSEEAFTVDSPVFALCDDGYVLESLPDTPAYTLPSVYDGLPVTGVGDGAFADCKSLVTLTLPEGLTKIGSGAFAGCESLAVVDLPSSLTELGDRAFLRCESLVDVGLPRSVTRLGDYAFAGCGSLERVGISGVTDIGTGAFSLCRSLSDVELSSELETVGDSAFYRCDSLTSVKLPASVKNVECYAFSGCSSLTIFSDGVPQYLGEGWHGARPYYLGCERLTARGGIYCDGGDGATLAAFEGDAVSAIVESSVPLGGGMTVKTIGAFAFAGSPVQTTTLPQTLETIGSNAFLRSAVTELTLPASLIAIGKNAFLHCFALDAVYIDSPDIAAALTDRSTCGYLASYASKIAVRSDVTVVNPYLSALTRLPDEVKNGENYHVYS